MKTEPSFQTLKIQNQSQARPINPASKKPTIGSATLAPTSQPDSITSQLNNGVRGLRLNLYDFEDDVWLCHSFGGQYFNYTSLQPTIRYSPQISLQ